MELQSDEAPGQGAYNPNKIRIMTAYADLVRVDR